MKKTLLLTTFALLASVMFASAAMAQDCFLPDGCDFDEDGVIDAPGPTGDQYSGEAQPLPVVFPNDGDEDSQNPDDAQNFCGLPEGCDLDGDDEVDVPAGTPAGDTSSDASEYYSSSVSSGAYAGVAGGEDVATAGDTAPTEDGVSSETAAATPVPGAASGDEVGTDTSGNSVASGAAPAGVLPDTGGNTGWIFALLGGALVACGLLAALGAGRVRS